MTAHRRHAWEPLLGAAERAMAADYPAQDVAAQAPALLLVDLYNKAYGVRREPIEISRQRFPSSCGEAGWDAIEPTRRLLDAAHANGVPAVYSTGEDRPEARVGAATRRSHRSADAWSLEIKDELQPRAGDLVVYKNAPSAFFATSLPTHLRRLGVDCVVIAGETTSGCVRATAVDAHSHGLDVIVVEDACFDRTPLSHAFSLFDLHHKYATVMWSDEVVARLHRGGAP